MEVYGQVPNENIAWWETLVQWYREHRLQKRFQREIHRTNAFEQYRGFFDYNQSPEDGEAKEG